MVFTVDSLFFMGMDIGFFKRHWIFKLHDFWFLWIVDGFSDTDAYKFVDDGLPLVFRILGGFSGIGFLIFSDWMIGFQMILVQSGF